MTMTMVTGMDEFQVGDKVLVLDRGLAQLRAICPDMPPNHHGRIAEIREDGDLLIEFPISGGKDSYDHSQVVPYPPHEVRKRKESNT